MLFNKCYRLNVEENHQWVKNINIPQMVWVTYGKLTTCPCAIPHGLKMRLNDQSWRRRQMETFSALLALCVGNSPITGEFPSHKGQWRGAFMFSFISVWINGWVNNRKAGDLRRNRDDYDVIVMFNSGIARRHIHFFTFCNVKCLSMLITNCLYIYINQTRNPDIQLIYTRFRADLNTSTTSAQMASDAESFHLMTSSWMKTVRNMSTVSKRTWDSNSFNSMVPFLPDREMPFL